VVTYIQEFRQSPLAPVYAGAIGVEVGKPFNRDNRGSFISPALQVASVDFEDPNPTPGARATFRLRICHATTPIDARHMHYFWSFGRDHGTSPDMMERLHAAVSTGFAEDEAIICTVQETMDRVPFSDAPPEISVRSDTAAVQTRRALARWMAREA
jgi:vanillate O-demethylase monooxygenase subunit